MTYDKKINPKNLFRDDDEFTEYSGEYDENAFSSSSNCKVSLVNTNFKTNYSHSKNNKKSSLSSSHKSHCKLWKNTPYYEHKKKDKVLEKTSQNTYDVLKEFNIDRCLYRIEHEAILLYSCKYWKKSETARQHLYQNYCELAKIIDAINSLSIQIFFRFVLVEGYDLQKASRIAFGKTISKWPLYSMCKEVNINISKDRGSFSNAEFNDWAKSYSYVIDYMYEHIIYVITGRTIDGYKNSSVEYSTNEDGHEVENNSYLNSLDDVDKLKDKTDQYNEEEQDENEDEYNLSEYDLFDILDDEAFILGKSPDYWTDEKSSKRTYNIYHQLYKIHNDITIETFKNLLRNYLVDGINQNKNAEMTLGKGISGVTVYWILSYFDVGDGSQYKGKFNNHKFNLYIKEVSYLIDELYKHLCRVFDSLILIKINKPIN